MRVRYVVAIGGLALMGWISSACVKFGTEGKPLVFPSSARLGDTVGVALDSTNNPLGPNAQDDGLSADNVQIDLVDTSTNQSVLAAPIAPRLIFDGLGAPTSQVASVHPGQRLTVALFDVPTTIPTGITVYVVPIRGGVTWPISAAGRLTISGPGGAPLDFYTNSVTDPLDLAARPMLRLHGILDALGANGFDPSWTIGSIQFTLVYPAAQVTPTSVHGATEAAESLVLLDTSGSAGTAQITLVDPRGLTLPSWGPFVGLGPSIDVVMQKATGQGFVSGDFAIQGLEVRDLNGNLLTPSVAPDTDTSQFFQLVTVRNLP